ncbi:peptidoglycan D,D-transpeptidase FtsI family protein [Streptomyces sp. NPDC060194]|uniref:peptidoglycan D,D-transpeptidase FtsI family protein n=1 Tax=Streptomyces sp. NPDC060194 TaxID=3347069 RepID=UPI00365907C3
MNKPLRRIAIFCGLLVFALLIRDNWLQYVRADELRTHANNKRVDIERYASPRGNIVVDGKEITGSKATDDTYYKYKRTYKDGPMWAPVTGFASQAFGANQLESLEDGILTGTDDRLFFRRTIDMITGKKPGGGNVVTTLNGAAQKAAFEGLGDRKGAVAAIEPSTGRILALVSTPSYDPSEFAGQSTADGKAWNRLGDDKDKPMLNRALRETYAPGSTFKVVTAAAALENGLYNGIDDKTDSPSPYKLPLTDGRNPLTNLSDAGCEDGSMKVALGQSCNTVFAKISDDLGNDKMIEQAKKFGFGQEFFTPVRAEASDYPEDNRPQNAMAGIGQASNRATPLQMAVVAGAIANDGVVMKPNMVSELKAPNLDTVERSKPEEFGRAVSPENAQKLQQMMEYVVTDGSARGKVGLGDGYKIGAKTGTAQRGVNNSENPYAWFISYAQAADGSSPVAVAVIVEDAGVDRNQITGSGIAAPIAQKVMEAVVGRK